ncbi:MAG: hypothetical protein K6C37_02260 [Bacteroidales bacterium]|nr:hypothetical protein [Bacteroidales bacterium]
MENKGTENFKELFNRLEEVKKEIAEIEARLQMLASAPAETVSEPDNSGPIDISLDIDEPVSVAAEPVVEEVAADDLPAVEDVPTVEDVPVVEDIPVAEDVPAVEEAPAVEDLPEDLFGAPAATKPAPHAHKSKGKAPLVLDAMAGDAAWRTDIPGPEVKSLRSAIALGDQVVFINRLFRKDSALYQDTVDRLNAMGSLSEAIGYLSGTFPEWDLNSDDVYKFMMAVRRRIRK